MRLIHTADIHLGAGLGSSLPADKIPQRKRELIDSFVRIAEYAEDNYIDAILLSGDVFDSSLPSMNDKEFFYDTVKRHPGILFFYLKGNHDSLSSYAEDGIPNLFTFGEEWTSYRFGNVCIHGIELPEKNKRDAASKFRCDPSDVNIVMLHGQIGGSSDDIVVGDYAGKGIDYMALGHIHSFSAGDIDLRGKYVYCGCPEGRGFDEAGEKGFVVIDTDGGVSFSFRPFACRTVRIVEKDVSDISTKQAAVAEAAELCETIPRSDIVRLIFKGEACFDTAGMAAQTGQILNRMFFHANVKDLTTEKPDIAALMKEETLAGEFVRITSKADLPEGIDRGRLITIGLRALGGSIGDYVKER